MRTTLQSEVIDAACLRIRSSNIAKSANHGWREGGGARKEMTYAKLHDQTPFNLRKTEGNPPFASGFPDRYIS